MIRGQMIVEQISFMFFLFVYLLPESLSNSGHWQQNLRSPTWFTMIMGNLMNKEAVLASIKVRR